MLGCVSSTISSLTSVVLIIVLAASELNSVDGTVYLLGELSILFLRFLIMVDGRTSMMTLNTFLLDLGGSLFFSFEDRIAKRR
jgi:hypothetical protein